jgi:Ca2+-transporting ATPase
VNEERAFAESIAAVAARLTTDPERGLSSSEAFGRRQQFGPNKLAEAAPPPWLLGFFEQFNQLVIWILLAATIVSAVLGDWLEAGAIFAIVLLNALLGFFQERKAEAALTSLRKLSSPNAKVLRDGGLHNVPAEELVPGDIVELEAGDRVPADLRLIKSFGLKTQEATLTGESIPIEKEADVILPGEATMAERINTAFMGTSVVAGKGRGLVTATAMESELGRIAGFLQTEEREPTPLQKRLEELGRVLIFACLGLIALIFVLQLLRGETFAHTFLLGVSLAVAAVPEGLPAVVTIALALGLQRMVRRNALIRRLASVETLGSVTVICSDKTGTLTRNEMTVTEIRTAAQNYRITGSGYVPEGQILRENSEPVQLENEAELALALKIGLWCNNSPLEAPNEPFFTRERGLRIMLHGLLISSAMVGGFAYAFREAGIAYAQAFVFYVTTFAQLFFSFACRSQRYTLPELGLFSNPYLLGAIVLSSILQTGLICLPLTRHVFFGTSPSFGFDWFLIFGLALAPVSIIEIGKIIRGRFDGHDCGT